MPVAAPLPPDELERLDALRAHAVLDTPPEERFDRLTRLASTVLGTPVALVSLVDAGRQWFKSRVGIDACETPRGVAFCAHAILGRDVFVVEDAAADPRFKANPLVSGEPGIRFYAGAPLVTGDGRAIGTLCVIDFAPRVIEAQGRRVLADLAALVVDELELRRSLAALERQQEEIAAAAKAKTAFLANVSHEFRTPLNAIIGFSDLLYEQHHGSLGDPRYLDYAQDVRAAGQALLTMVEDVLAVAKADGSRREPRQLDPNTEISAVVRATREAAEKAGVRVVCAARAGDLPSVVADAQALRRMLRNLVDNAIRHSPQGGAVTVEADVADGRLRIAVGDEGPGLSDDQIRNLGEPFFKASGGYSSAMGGLGMGVAVACRVAEGHGGGIAFRPRDGGAGLVAEVSLPLPPG